MGNRGTIKQAYTIVNSKMRVSITKDDVWLSLNMQETCMQLRMITIKTSERDDVVALAGIWINSPDWFGTHSSAHATPLCALIAFCFTCTTVAAKSHGVGEDRAGVDGAARQDGCTVLHLVVGAPSLDEEA